MVGASQATLVRGHASESACAINGKCVGASVVAASSRGMRPSHTLDMLRHAAGSGTFAHE